MPETIELNPGGAATVNVALKLRYEANADTNPFTDAEKAKLAGQEAGATADMTGAEIKAAYEAEDDTNAFTDADAAKLDGIEEGATGDLTPEEILAAYDIQVPVMSQAEAEAGISTAIRQITAERIKQAIAAQVVGGGGNLGTNMRFNGFGIGFSGSNDTGGTISKLTPVYLAGSALAIAAADADDPAKMPCLGIAAASIADEASGDIVTYGMITSANTSAWSVGDALYVSESSTLTSTAPIGSAVQPVARVVVSDVSEGIIFVNILPDGTPIGALTSTETTVSGDVLLLGDASADFAPIVRSVSNFLADHGLAVLADPKTIYGVNAQTGTAYTLVLADANKKITMNNGSANALTIPANAAVAFPVGTVLAVSQIGAGVTTIVADTGVTLNGVSAGSGAISARYTGVTLTKLATNTWLVEGNHGAVA